MKSINSKELADTGLVLVFGPGDERSIQKPHNDALVITAMMANYDITRILVPFPTTQPTFGGTTGG